MRKWKSITKPEKRLLFVMAAMEILVLIINLRFGSSFSWWCFGWSFGVFCSYVLVMYGWLPTGSAAAPELPDQEVTGNGQ